MVSVEARAGPEARLRELSPYLWEASASVPAQGAAPGKAGAACTAQSPGGACPNSISLGPVWASAHLQTARAPSIPKLGADRSGGRKVLWIPPSPKVCPSLQTSFSSLTGGSLKSLWWSWVLFGSPVTWNPLAVSQAWRDFSCAFFSSSLGS